MKRQKDVVVAGYCEMGLLEILAGMSIVHPVNALARGGQAFHVARGQGISGDELKYKLRRYGVKSHGWMILDGCIRFAVKRQDADRTAKLLTYLELSWR